MRALNHSAYYGWLMLRPSVRLGVLVCLVLSIWTQRNNVMAGLSEPERPIGSVVARVDDAAQQTFLDRVKEFAETKAFAIRISQTNPDGKHFLVQMWREDVNIVAVNPFEDAQEFRINFYQTGTQSVPAEVISELVNELRRSLAAIEGVTLLEKRR